MKNILLLIILCLINISISYSQEVLTIEDAVNIGLKNNFDIMVARNQADISKSNNTKGNAGMLPTVQATGAGTFNSYKDYSIKILSAGTELNWTLYDGGKMFVTKEKLNEIENLGEIQFKSKVLETIYNITEKYYEIIKQKQQLNSINEVINFNQERVKIAQIGFDAGTLVKTDLLQAKIDLNVVKENAITQQYLIDISKKALSNLLGETSNNDYEVTDSINIDYLPNKNELFEKLNSSNINILNFQKQIDISKLELQENRSVYFPKFSISTGYIFSNVSSSYGSRLLNSLYGPQINGTLSIPLYNAGETDRKNAESQLQLQSAEIDLQYMKIQINTELQNALNDFENQQKLLEIETENNALAKENLEISLERLRYGQTTSLEVHLAQESYVQSFTRLINIKYNIKLSETKLKQLVADL